MLLRLGLELADAIVARLPARAAYAVADLAGDAWHRLAPGRRQRVAANLRRVCEATGRPTSGRAFDQLVRSAFRNHAHYYVELLRAPHYGVERIGRLVEVPNWEELAAAVASGPSVLVSSHLGNFEPFAVFLEAKGIASMAPIEEIEPRALFEFLASRRGGGSVELVPVRGARSALSRRLREGGLVGIIGDRLLDGGGQPVTMFGHPTSIPNGPAFLAVTHHAALVVGRCLRVAPDRFLVDGEVIDVPDTGDRRADVAALTERIAARFERDIGAAPEQWWGAFQPFWPDLPG
jgi:phosphatidylinositol dimannoside acyltransferase